MKNFSKQQEICLSSGAIIVPLLKLGKRTVACPEMTDYQGKNRWAVCKFQKECIDAAAELLCDGFSCEACPYKGKEENAFCFSQERALQDALRCAELLKKAFTFLG